MLYCEDCRVNKGWNYPATSPYDDRGRATCEVCTRRKDYCYSYPALYVKPRSSWTQEEIMLDKAIQHEYHQLAEGLIIAYSSGALNHERSETLKSVIVRDKQRGNEIDWYATFKLRQRVQEGYRRVDELNRDRR